jgi:hypothetical protein
MKTKFLLVAAALLSVVLMGAIPRSESPMVDVGRKADGAMDRAGIYQEWVDLDCSNVAEATSAELTSWTRHAITCEDDSRLDWGGTAVEATADANDGKIPAGAWLEFTAVPGRNFVSCLNVNSDSICRYIEVH